MLHIFATYNSNGTPRPQSDWSGSAVSPEQLKELKNFTVDDSEDQTELKETIALLQMEATKILSEKAPLHEARLNSDLKYLDKIFADSDFNEKQKIAFWEFLEGDRISNLYN